MDMLHTRPSEYASEDAPYGYNDLGGFIATMTGDEKHSRAATSTLDVIWTLYDRVLNVAPGDPTAPDRDRFYLSKGHGPMAYYAVLTAKGFLEPRELEEFGTFSSSLGYHPNRLQVQGVEISSGSLGHGLALGVGTMIGMAIGGLGGRVFCLIGDGELDEGSNHEAIAIAGRWDLSRLTAIVIDNHSSLLGWPGGIAGRFEIEGWTSDTIDGRDHVAIQRALTRPRHGSPHVVVADVGAHRD